MKFRLKFLPKLLLSFSLFFLILWLIPSSCWAAEYYVATDGSDSNPGTEVQPWRTIQKAANTLVAGDTVYIRAGIYQETIKPGRSGQEGAYITYTNYNNDEVVITNADYGADLRNRSYIILDGLKIQSVNKYWIYMWPNATHNIIKNCHMEESRANQMYYKGIFMQDGSDWNKIINNTLVAYNLKDPIWCFNSSYNLFEGNDISYGGHVSLNIQGPSGGVVKNVVRNNTIWNPWHHTVNVYHDADYTLFENNVLLDAGEDHENNIFGTERDRNMPRDRHNGLQLGASNCIVRNNIMINNGSGISLNSYDLSWARNNRIYHNTLYLNHIGIRTNYNDNTYDNVIKNNIFFQNRSYEMFRAWATPSDYYENNNVLGSNISFDSTVGDIEQIESQYPDYFSSNIKVDPLFVNQDDRNLQLKADSPMIDTALPLTTSMNSGSGTSIEVEDSKYFCDGYGVVDADWIKIGNSLPVQIASVDYDQNILILKEFRSWSAGEEINLYKDSSGKVVLYGSTHDIGAYEYIDETTPSCKPEDVNCDGKVNVTDLLFVLGAWGNTSGAEDINNDNKVDVSDLLMVLGEWG